MPGRGPVPSDPDADSNKPCSSLLLIPWPISRCRSGEGFSRPGFAPCAAAAVLASLPPLLLLPSLLLGETFDRTLDAAGIMQPQPDALLALDFLEELVSTIGNCAGDRQHSRCVKHLTDNLRCDTGGL